MQENNKDEGLKVACREKISSFFSPKIEGNERKIWDKRNRKEYVQRQMTVQFSLY